MSEDGDIGRMWRHFEEALEFYSAEEMYCEVEAMLCEVRTKLYGELQAAEIQEASNRGLQQEDVLRCAFRALADAHDAETFRTVMLEHLSEIDN